MPPDLAERERKEVGELLVDRLRSDRAEDLVHISNGRSGVHCGCTTVGLASPRGSSSARRAAPETIFARKKCLLSAVMV